LNDSMRDSLERLQYYVVFNGKGSIREIAENSSEYFISEARDKFTSKRTLLYSLSCLGTGCVLLILVFFVPYIMKVQRSILRVFDHISGIRQSEIGKILDMCYIFKDEIEAPIARLRQKYEKEDFTKTTDDLRREEKLKEEGDKKRSEKHKQLQGDGKAEATPGGRTPSKKHGKRKAAGNDDDNDHTKDNEQDADKSKDKSDEQTPRNSPSPNKNEAARAHKAKEQDPEQEYFVLTEERRAKAKKKLFSQITSAKRKGYICRLAVLFIFFAIFLLVDVFLLKAFYEQSVLGFDILGLLSSRQYTLMTAVLFYREDLVSKTKLLSSCTTF
jgi:hypothetical protein